VFVVTRFIGFSPGRDRMNAVTTNFFNGLSAPRVEQELLAP